MSKSISKCLVIDASVARAAGPPHTSHPTSSNCRIFLENVLKICHKIVMTPEIRQEWDQHQSRFARQWLATMVAKKKLLPLKNLPTNSSLWDCLERIAETDEQRGQIIKDVHLLEAALASDKTIISLDEKTARRFFRRAAKESSILQTIVWVNPNRVEEEQPIAWLEAGAIPEEKRLLGYIGE
ncbi:MAG: hypothetical protein F6J86_34400 [Symploca sp. SIO1B1]|nr:hypothetical protein [Symploca sp. SIO1B1]